MVWCLVLEPRQRILVDWHVLDDDLIEVDKVSVFHTGLFVVSKAKEFPGTCGLECSVDTVLYRATQPWGCAG